jgi:mRNA interferase HigB
MLHFSVCTFIIKGNGYGLVVAIDYSRGIVFIKWRSSHEEYDKIDVSTVQYVDQAHQD